MRKLPMYIIMAISMGAGSYLPTLLGQSILGGWSVLGSVIGGIFGIVIYAKLRKAGYIE